MNAATLREANSLLAVALRHYRVEVRDRVVRYKQLVLLLALLMLPGLPAFKAVFVEPLTYLFRSDATHTASITSLLAYMALAVFWAQLQKDVIAPVNGRSYLATLPLSHAAVLCRDAVMLLFASTPLLMLLLLAIAAIPSVERREQSLATLLAVVVSTLVTQIGASRRYLIALLAGPVSAGVAVLVPASGLTLVLALFISALVLRDTPVLGANGSSEFRDQRSRQRDDGHRRAICSGWLALQWRAIWLSGIGAFRTALSLNAVLGIATAAALFTDEPSAARSTRLIIAFAGLSSLFLAMSFATLRVQHACYKQYISTLPLSPARFRAGVILVVQGPCFSAVCVLVALSLVRIGFNTILLLPIAATVILAFLHYMFYQVAPRHAVLCGLLAMLVCLAVAAAIT